MTDRQPSPGELRVFEAVLAALADHGFTPTAIAARLTYLSAPDSLQGALAAGLLGGGSRYLGVTEDTARFLHAALAAADGQAPESDEDYDGLALRAIKERRAAGALVPGLGHPIHKRQDPRTPVLIGIAEEEGVRGPHLRLTVFLYVDYETSSAGMRHRCATGREPGKGAWRKHRRRCRLLTVRS